MSKAVARARVRGLLQPPLPKLHSLNQGGAPKYSGVSLTLSGHAKRRPVEERADRPYIRAAVAYTWLCVMCALLEFYSAFRVHARDVGAALQLLILEKLP